MCSVENINKISNFLKVNPGKLSYNTDKIVTRTSKSNETLSGFSTIISSLATESKELCSKNSVIDLETKCLVSNWLDYSVLFISSAAKDKHLTNIMLKELNYFLNCRSYLVGNKMTVADVAVFYTIEDVMGSLSALEKEAYLNISRWFDHLQQQKAILQGNQPVNFSIIHLLGWATGTHI